MKASGFEMRLTAMQAVKRRVAAQTGSLCAALFCSEKMKHNPNVSVHVLGFRVTAAQKESSGAELVNNQKT